MPKRSYDHSNRKPRTLHDARIKRIDVEDGVTAIAYGCSFIDPSITLLANDDWYKFLISFGEHDDNVLYDNINNYIDENYGYRKILPSILDQYESNWTSSDYSELSADFKTITTRILLKNREKYTKLYDAMTLEFNPLWNVDGTEQTVRILTKEGDVTDTHSGNDKVIKDGTDTYRKFGDETSTETGHTITDHTGTDTYVDTGTEDNTRTGSRDLTTTGGEIDTRYKGTTDSATLLQVEQNVKKYDDGASQHNTKETETFTNLKDTKTFNNRQNQRTANLTDDIEHGKTITNSFDQRYDEQEYDSNVKTEYDSELKKNFDTKDKENITVTRHGNIGVTTTTKLLTEYIDFALYANFIDIVCKDVLEMISLSVY